MVLEFKIKPFIFLETLYGLFEPFDTRIKQILWYTKWYFEKNSCRVIAWAWTMFKNGTYSHFLEKIGVWLC